MCWLSLGAFAEVETDWSDEWLCGEFRARAKLCPDDFPLVDCNSGLAFELDFEEVCVVIGVAPLGLYRTGKLEFFFGDVDAHLFGQLSASGCSVGLSALQATAGQCDSPLVGVADQEQAFIVPDRHVGTLEGGTPQSPLHEQGAVAQPKSSSVQRIPHG